MSKNKYLLTLVLIGLIGLASAQVDTAWVRRYNGSPGNGTDYAVAIAVDGAGNVYVTGQSDAAGTVERDWATIKYNSAGDTLWVRRYNGPGNGFDIARAIAVDGAGNVYVTGYTFGSGTGYDYATIKYNSAGDTLWVRRYNGPGNGYDFALALAVDGMGNVYVTGYGHGSGTGYDYATIKYNSAGDSLWVARYNGPGNGVDCANAIAVDGTGNVYVTGQSKGISTGDADYATIKYNSAGDSLWVARYNGPGNDADCAYAIAVDGAGNVYVTGNSTGIGTADDYATIKYNSAGNQQWVARYDGPGNGIDMANALAVDGTGNVYMTGWSTGSGTGADYTTIKYVQTPGVEENRQPLSAGRYSLTAEPNPFTKHTTIRYTVPIAGKVSIKLYNATGRLIETLVNDNLNAGTYTLKIENWKSKISKGVYFLKYESDTDKSVLKLIVQ